MLSCGGATSAPSFHKTGTVLPSPDAISDETLVSVFRTETLMSFANFWKVFLIMDRGG